MTMPIEGTRRGSGSSPKRRHLHLIREGTAPFLPVSEGPRRVLNIVVALLGIILTLPLWILIAIAVKLTSRGPVIYTQTRSGWISGPPATAPTIPGAGRTSAARPFGPVPSRP